MTNDPYIPPSNDGEPTGGTPPYQQGSTPGVPPYQPAPGQQGAGPFGGQPHQQQYQQQPYGQPNQQQPYGQPHQQYTPGLAPLAPPEERTWSIVAHLAPVAGALLSVGWLNFLGPLLVHLVYKDRSPRVRAAAAGAFNFSVTLWIINLIAWISFITIIGIPLAIVLWIGEVIALFVYHIMGAVKAANDEPFTYPLQIPILK